MHCFQVHCCCSSWRHRAAWAIVQCAGIVQSLFIIKLHEKKKIVVVVIVSRRKRHKNVLWRFWKKYEKPRYCFQPGICKVFFLELCIWWLYHRTRPERCRCSQLPQGGPGRAWRLVGVELCRFFVSHTIFVPVLLRFAPWLYEVLWAEPQHTKEEGVPAHKRRVRRQTFSPPWPPRSADDPFAR